MIFELIRILESLPVFADIVHAFKSRLHRLNLVDGGQHTYVSKRNQSAYNGQQDCFIQVFQIVGCHSNEELIHKDRK